jgi:hypothetical protein
MLMAFSAPDGYSREISKNVRKLGWVFGGTYAELDWDRKEIAASLLYNSLATRNAWKIDECRLYDALFSLYCLHETFGEAEIVR